MQSHLCHYRHVQVRQPLRGVFARLPAGAALVEAPVSRAQWSGNADHPYRRPPFDAHGVPCLLRLGPGGVEASLTEREILSANLEAFTGLSPRDGTNASTGNVPGAAKKEAQSPVVASNWNVANGAHVLALAI